MKFYLGQLRHLYQQMIAGSVTDTAEAARGLLGPAIEEAEKVADALEKARAELALATEVIRQLRTARYDTERALAKWDESHR